MVTRGKGREGTGGYGVSGEGRAGRERMCVLVKRCRGRWAQGPFNHMDLIYLGGKSFPECSSRHVVSLHRLNDLGRAAYSERFRRLCTAVCPTSPA